MTVAHSSGNRTTNLVLMAGRWQDHIREVVRIDKRDWTDTESEKTDAYSADRFDDITFYDLLELRTLHIIVG